MSLVNQKSLPFDERLGALGQMVTCARISYDIWWLYHGEETRPKFIKIINEYSEFFRFDENAHFLAMIMYLAQLFESDPKTTNLSALISEARESGKFPKDAIAPAEAAMVAAEPLIQKVTILRSNLFAHRSGKLSYAGAFRKAAIKPNSLRDLTEASLTVVNVLLRAAGKDETAFNDLSLIDAEDMLRSLAGVDPSRRRGAETLWE